jgi:hypothetical protein
VFTQLLWGTTCRHLPVTKSVTNSVMLSCWQNIEWYHIFVYPHVCSQGLPHNRCCHPVSKFLVFIWSVHQSDLLNHFGMFCTQRNLFPNHHVLPLDSNKFSVNWVCVFCLMHARTESHLAPPCWYNFPVSQTLPLLYTYVHNLNKYLAISTSILTLVLHTCNHEMLFWLLQQALLLLH